MLLFGYPLTNYHLIALVSRGRDALEISLMYSAVFGGTILKNLCV
jgi:hypothetical protein